MTETTIETPFLPPIEGSRIERVHRVGPFVMRVDLRLPDGRRWSWTSRRHRFLGGMRSIPEASLAAEETEVWWLTVGILARIGWCIAALFMIGSACFAAASAAGLLPKLFGTFAQDPAAVNLVFFVGSIFFTLAAYLQFLAAVNADRISAIAHRTRPRQPFRWFALKTGEIGWLSASLQLVGTLLFNVNTFDALLPDLDWLQEDLLIWTPDILGSVCFLFASALAGVEYGEGRWVWRPGDVSWWTVNINMLGSVCFGLSAVYAVALPGTGELLDVQAVNLWTFFGAICFLVGAYLLLPELRRNLKAIIPQAPS